MAVAQDVVHRVLVFTKKGAEIRYVLTNNDYLTLARSVEFEGPPKVAVAWTLIQRFAYLYPTYTSLAEFIKAYSQPINPRWFPTGQEHLALYSLLKQKNDLIGAAREDMQAKRRVTFAATPMASIRPDTIAAIHKVFTDHTSPIPASLHFHAPSLSMSHEAMAKSKNLTPIAIAAKGNWFFGIGTHAVHVLALLENTGALGAAFLALTYAAGMMYFVKRLCT
jgi:hypothetical protein